jgi:hypothetical protein
VTKPFLSDGLNYQVRCLQPKSFEKLEYFYKLRSNFEVTPVFKKVAGIPEEDL